MCAIDEILFDIERNPIRAWQQFEEKLSNDYRNKNLEAILSFDRMQNYHKQQDLTTEVQTRIYFFMMCPIDDIIKKVVENMKFSIV